MPNDSSKNGTGWKFAGAAAVASALLGVAYWYRRPLPTALVGEGNEAEYSWLYFYLPEAEFVGEVYVDIHAPASAIFDAIRRVTVDDMPLAKGIGTLRYLPSKLAGEASGKIELD